MNNEPNKPVELTNKELESVVGGARSLEEIGKEDQLKIETNDWFSAELAR